MIGRLKFILVHKQPPWLMIDVGGVGYELEAQVESVVPDLDAALDDQVGDDLLSLVFTACHPVLSPEARAALQAACAARPENRRHAWHPRPPRCPRRPPR